MFSAWRARPARVPAERLEDRTLLATFLVTDPADTGPGTLRQAILGANAAAGADVIAFNLPGEGPVRTIRPLSALPEITDLTTLDGRTQPGAAVELDGSLAGPDANGLTVAAVKGSLIRGLVINRFSGHGVSVVSGGGVRIQGNYIGTDATGNVDLGNGGAGVRVAAGDVVLGDSKLLDTGNVISGNGLAGVWIPPGAAPNSGAVQIYGNRIGTNAAGDRAIPNDGDGVLAEWGGSVLIGAGILAAARNVISGNRGNGVQFAGSGPTSAYTSANVSGNYIGTDASGAAALGNGEDGVRVGAGSPTVRWNVVSANGVDGVRVASQGAKVQANFIGTDASGTAALGNARDGVAVEGFSAGIGGDARVSFPMSLGNSGGNLISGNGRHGVSYVDTVAHSAYMGAISGNFIGTDVTGTKALGNGGSGLFLSTLWTSAGANVICANGGDGVTIAPGAPGTAAARIYSSALLSGNRIGVGLTDSRSTVPPPALGNAGNGVAIHDSRVTARGNTIAFNAGAGVLATGPKAEADLAQYSGNLIYSNGGLGIDLAATGDAPDGVTPNDSGDADSGPSGLQNFPTVTFATSGVNGSKIRYSFDSLPDQLYTLDFFANASPDPSGNGEGQTFLAYGSVKTDAAGHAEGAVDTTLPTAGLYVTATASLQIREDGVVRYKTSEFSPPILGVQGPTDAAVVGRHVFYNNSAFDGGADGPADDAAIATDKRALLPGESASFANVTSYTKGLNGVMIDVRGLPADAVINSNDFEFRAWRGDDPFEMKEVYNVSAYPVTVRRGAGDGGSDRITLYIPDYPSSDKVIPFGLANLWLQVTLKANPDTALPAPDVFRFGNLIGETGDDAPPTLRVNAVDLARTRAHLTPRAGVDNPYDHNRDGRVNAFDLAAVRVNYLQGLFVLDMPAPVAPASVALHAPITEQVLGG
jgi:hypothetical protein